MIQERLDNKDLKVSVVLQDLKEFQAKKELTVFKDQRVPKDTPAILVSRVFQEQPANKAQLAPKDLRVPLVHKV